MCATEELEALVAGTLDDAERARVEAHLAGCAACTDELAWLRTEAELMARRRQAQPAATAAQWERIAARVTPGAPAQSAPVEPQRWGLGARIAYGGLIAAAAAAVLLATMPQLKLFSRRVSDSSTAVMRSTAMAPRKKVSPDVTFDRAEQEYRDAAAVLEAEYRHERARLPAPVAEQYDRMLLRTRTRVADASEAAGSDVDGRMVVLDGYAEYLHSLQTIVTDIR